MDVSISMSLCNRIKSKHVNQQIQKKFKNRHKNKANQIKKSNLKRNKKHIQPKKRKHKRQSKSLVSSHQLQCDELQFKSSNILALKDYIKPKLHSEAPYIINHTTYYDLADLMPSSSSRRRRNKRKTHKTPRSITTPDQPEPALYDDKYIQSTNACKWIKLKRGKFFNFSFYIFNRDKDIHDIELTRREENQNIHFIADFLQNAIEQIYTNIVLSHDIALVVGEFCRGYLIGRCYNENCKTYVKFFYEDRYNGVDTYFAISHAFEQNDIMYCSECLLNETTCKIRKCECGETDFAHQFNTYLCYTYDEEKDAANQIVIDEFKCNCTGHKTRCSRHKTCNKCQNATCRECELFGWGLDAHGVCTNCNDIADDVMSECTGCLHRFNEDKMCVCTLCDDRYCDGIKWKKDLMDRTTLQREYDAYLNGYKCGCNNWKAKYFGAAHNINLWYPIYSEWQRRIELGAADACAMKNTLQCMICHTNYAICKGCDAKQVGTRFICDTCHRSRTQTCDLCRAQCIYCETDDGEYEGARLDHMEQRRCVECDDMCFICSICYDECHGEYFGLYLCLQCKQTDKKQCVYCNETFINHTLWDKICGKKTDKFRYFVENAQCKQCQYDITNVCNGCHDIYGLRCIHCVNDGICVQCNARIPSKGGYVSLCGACFNMPCCVTKDSNMFLSSRIDKRWKNSHSHRKRKKNQRKRKSNKDGKFLYDIGYNRKYMECDVIQINPKWKKYRKTSKKRRY
eukprot:182888_1